MNIFFSLDEIHRITSPEYLNEKVRQDDDVVVDGLIEKITTAGYRYEYEERAAILEYDGGLSRKAADAQALDEIKHRMQFLGGDEIC